ncbi:hypothetical protein [Amorphus sp. 3PC139-8]|uniref:hypothetical protein n=1 Tax=Amorphus sp. 3PC139-8 TaxID=2735676 RepID=UPI00345CD747
MSAPASRSLRARLAPVVVAALVVGHQPAAGGPRSESPASPGAPARFDRGVQLAIDVEVADVMEMTPPDRRVTIDLPLGGSIDISASRILVGRNGADCRRFDYLYRAPSGGTATVSGQRCWDLARGWVADRPDALISEQDLPPPLSDLPVSGPPAVGRRSPVGASGYGGMASGISEAGSPASSGPVNAPGPTVIGTSNEMRSTLAPPSRVILPFPLDGLDHGPIGPR